MSGGGDFGRAAVRAAIGLGKGATGGAVSPHPPPPSTPAASLLLLAIYSDRRRPSSPPDSPGRNLTTSGRRHHRHLSPPLLIASSRAPPTPQQTRQWRAPRRRRRGWTSTTSSTACAAPTSPSPDPACRCTGNADRLPPRIWPSPPPASPDPGSSPPDPASPPSDSALSADFRPPPVAVTHSSPDPAVSSARDRRAVARGRRAVRSPAWSGRLHLGPDPKGMGVMLEQCSCSQGSGFKLIWNSVKGFLDPKTSSKIHVLGSNYQSRLLEVIDSSELPEFLGGSCTCGDKGGCLGSNKGPWNDPFILKLVHNLEAGFAREIKPISDGEESNSSLRLEQLKWQGMISDTSNAESGSDVDDFGSSFFQKAADYGCLTPVHEECCVIWPTHINQRPDSDFKRRLMEVLLKPISRREYIKLFDMASIRTPLVKLRQVRNDVKFYPTDEMGNSYFDHYPGHGLPDMTYGSSLQPIEDLVEQVTNTSFSNGLALMRGFFFWLQNTAHEDQFRPWIHDSEDHEVIPLMD